jgi:probable phosphoglycerate mutase
MAIILLIRHAENDYLKEGRLAGRQPGIHLNEAGRAQAEALAQGLAQAPLKAVYSSPLERALETAVPIARASGLEVIPRSGLNEVDFGTWQNRTLKQLRRRKLWRIVQFAPSQAQFPQGETFRAAQDRIVTELMELSSQHKTKDLVACVTHSDIIKLAVAYFLGLPLDFFQRMVISPASITALNLHPNGARLIHLNHTLSPPWMKP